MVNFYRFKTNFEVTLFFKEKPNYSPISIQYIYELDEYFVWSWDLK